MNEYEGFLPNIAESYKRNPKRRSTSAARAYTTLQDSSIKQNMNLTVSDYNDDQLNAKPERTEVTPNTVARKIIDKALNSVALRRAPRGIREVQKKGKVTLDALMLHEDLRIAREHLDVGVYQANKMSKKRIVINVEKKPINLKDLKEIYYTNYIDGVLILNINH